MNKKSVINWLLVLVSLFLLVYIIMNLGNEGEQIYSCRKINDFDEDIFTDNKYVYDGDFAYLDFTYYDNYDLYAMDEFCILKDDGMPRNYACEIDHSKLYYYDLATILDSINPYMILSDEGANKGCNRCEEILYKDTLVYQLLNADNKIIPIPSCYRGIIDMHGGRNENVDIYHYNFYDRQQEDTFDGLALVSLELIDLDEAWVISLQYRYAYEENGEHIEKIFPSYGYILKIQ